MTTRLVVPALGHCSTIPSLPFFRPFPFLHAAHYTAHTAHTALHTAHCTTTHPQHYRHLFRSALNLPCTLPLVLLFALVTSPLRPCLKLLLQATLEFHWLPPASLLLATCYLLPYAKTRTAGYERRPAVICLSPVLSAAATHSKVQQIRGNVHLPAEPSFHHSIIPSTSSSSLSKQTGRRLSHYPPPLPCIV